MFSGWVRELPATTRTVTLMTCAGLWGRARWFSAGKRIRTTPIILPLQENWERIKDMRLEDGSKLEVVPLPMPSPVYLDGQRLPASYANFYISNAAVLVPTFNDPQRPHRSGNPRGPLSRSPRGGNSRRRFGLGFGNLALPHSTAAGGLIVSFLYGAT